MFQDFDTAAPPLPARGSDWRDYVVPQGWEHFTDDDHAVWDLLFARQVELLGTRVVAPFLEGIDLLQLAHPGIPELGELNRRIEPRTGWRTVAVPGLVPDDVFFAMLRDRVFPVGNFIRKRAQLDYLEEPDCFHDLFGHIPMLSDPRFAAMVEHVGHLGGAAIAAGRGELAARAWRRASARRISASRATASSGTFSPRRGRSTPPTSTMRSSRSTSSPIRSTP